MEFEETLALLEEQNYDIDVVLAFGDPVRIEDIPTRVSIGELLQEQESDELCCQISRQTGKGRGSTFQNDPDTGVLLRKRLNTHQIVAPLTLRPKILNMAHYLPISGHLGAKTLYLAIRRDYYLASPALDAYAVVRNCAECAKKRVGLRKRSTQLKLFPAAAPLEDIAMDLLGELFTTPRGNKCILVITDRFSKMVPVIALSSTRAIDIAEAFTGTGYSSTDLHTQF